MTCVFVQVLDATATCHDQQVFNNCILYMGFKKPNTKDDFEPLEEIAPGVDFSYDFPSMPKKKDDD